MAALWSVGSVGVYVNDLERSKEGLWAEIDIIDATETTLHWFGAKSVRYRVSGTVWDRDNIDTLEAYMEASTTRVFAGPNSLSENMKLINVSSRRIPDKSDVTNECFRVEIEMMRTT